MISVTTPRPAATATTTAGLRLKREVLVLQAVTLNHTAKNPKPEILG